MIEVDVLVVGCGPAGLTAALALARQGTRVLAITKHPRLSQTPRAHVTNQRSFEILRDFGLEQKALSAATDYARMPNFIFLRSLAGQEFGRLKGLGQERSSNDSPCMLADLPQNLLEPILFEAAAGHGASVRFSTELISFDQDFKGVTASLRDRVSHEALTVRSKYLVGADGGRSRIAEALGLPFEGHGKMGGSLNIIFECDLTSYVAHRPGCLYFFVRTMQDTDGAGLGILRCVEPWTKWLMIKGYAAGQQTPEISNEDATEVIRDYLGVAELKVHITAVDRGDLNDLYATRYHQGRVFCMGDAVHRHPPSNGLGSNTAIQDAYNLAWKLDLVLQGKANPDLLESYSAERVPVGQQVVARAVKSLQSYTPVLQAVGVLNAMGPDPAAARNMAEIAMGTAAGQQRRRDLQESIALKRGELHTRGVELNQMYRSLAIVDEGQTVPESGLDTEIFYLATSCPGAKLPHAWIQRDGRDISTLDLAGGGRFTVLTGIGGAGWVHAAAAASLSFGIKCSAFTIGPGGDVTDLYFQWANVREIEEDGCLLIRPDGYVAWRCQTKEGVDAVQAVREVFKRILHR